jgi:hypothetical protein
MLFFISGKKPGKEREEELKRHMEILKKVKFVP